MKRLLIITGLLMFGSALWQPMVSLGQEQFSDREEDIPFSTARLFSKLVETTGLDPNADWTQSFGEDDLEDVGQDLYLLIYDRTKNQPQLQANKETAGQYGLTEGEMIRILHGDFDVIADRKPSLTQEELQSKLVEIQQEHAWRKESLALEAKVRSAVEASEVFANGDLSDSGFDLIHDLEIIEELLFLQTDPIDIGRSYTRAGGDSGDLAAVGQAGGTGDRLFGPEGTARPSDEASALTAESGVPRATAPSSESTDGDSSESSAHDAPLDGLDPGVCFADDQYGTILAEFEQKAQEDFQYKDGAIGVDSTDGSGTSESGQSGSDSAGEGPTGTTSQELGTDDFLALQNDIPDTPVSPAPAANWLEDKPCDGPFCLEVNFVEKPATSAFANSDNCIACHIEKMNDVLKTVVNHSLLPSKAPGNLGEAAQCKKALDLSLSAINMNIYSIAMPVQTPRNDDLIFTTDIEEEWQQFCDQVGFFPFDACGGALTESPAASSSVNSYTPPPILEDRATKEALIEVPEGATNEEVSARINEIVAGYTLESRQRRSIFEQEQQADESFIVYHPLLAEMDQMNYFFTNIRDVLHSLHEAVPGLPGPQACTSLHNKKACE